MLIERLEAAIFRGAKIEKVKTEKKSKEQVFEESRSDLVAS